MSVGSTVAVFMVAAANAKSPPVARESGQSRSAQSRLSRAEATPVPAGSPPSLLHRRAGRCGSARSTGRSPWPCTPAARSRRAPRSDAPRRIAARRASPLFCGHVPQHGVVQHLLGEQPLQLRVLVLERLQPPGVRHFHPMDRVSQIVYRNVTQKWLRSASGERGNCEKLCTLGGLEDRTGGHGGGETGIRTLGGR